MNSIDPTQLKLIQGIVNKVSDKYTRVYQKLYGGSAKGYGYGKVDSGTWQAIRMPRFEGTLPEVPNKMDVSPVISTPDWKPITATSRDFRAKYIYLIDDEMEDKLGYYAHQAAGFADAIERTVEVMAHEIFNRATDSTFTSGWDGKPLGDHAHLIENGGTYDNLLAPQPPSEALLEQIYEYGARIPTAGGWPIKESSFTIITTTSYARRWKQLVGAETAFTHPQGGGANANPAIKNLFATEDGSITIVGTPYLFKSTTQIVLFNGHEVALKERWRKTYEYDNKDPEGVAQVAKLRLVNYWGDARRVIVIDN